MIFDRTEIHCEAPNGIAVLTVNISLGNGYNGPIVGFPILKTGYGEFSDWGTFHIDRWLGFDSKINVILRSITITNLIPEYCLDSVRLYLKFIACPELVVGLKPLISQGCTCFKRLITVKCYYLILFIIYKG